VQADFEERVARGAMLYGKVDRHLSPDGNAALADLILPVAARLLAAGEPGTGRPGATHAARVSEPGRLQRPGRRTAGSNRCSTCRAVESTGSVSPGERMPHAARYTGPR
jgi:hypothetical protein